MIYDSILIIALLFFATLPVTFLNKGAIQADGSIKHLGFILYLLLVWFSFYGWFWTHGGQTLGMSVWRIKVVALDGCALGWRAALIRWCSACLGLANLTSLLNKERAGWHEKLSATRTISLLNP